MSSSLPFNTMMIRSLFTPLSPDQESDDTPGFLAVLQGNSLVVPVGVEQALLRDGSLSAAIVP
ncbi:MAG: hypothetical protein HIU83_12735, partial [Proteobacteria bacterium]|nr:hypothetical protein [Pseudomonadota bacterium]